MKTALNISAAILALSLTQAAQATPMTINDDYYGGDDHGYGDVIGDAGKFGIDSMDVDISGNILTVSINTAFGGRGDDGLFSSYTYGKGIGYGDLFLSDSWMPYGMPNFLDDDNSTGTVWTYGFSLDDRWMAEGTGTGSLYRLNAANNDADTLLSQDFLSGATFRNGQEIAVDTSSKTVSYINQGSWSTSSGGVSFTIDLTGTELASSKTIALHWGMTCGNDVIEGEYARGVPAPGILALLATGLAGFGLFRRKARQ